MARDKREIRERRPRVLSAVTLRLSLLMGAVWLIMMFCITMAAVLNLKEVIVEDIHTILARDGRYTSISEALEYDDGTPGYLEYYIWDSIYWESRYTRYMSYDNEVINVLRDVEIQYEPATVVIYKEGEAPYESGDYIYFYYITEDEWDAGSDYGEMGARALLDEDILPKEDRERVQELFRGMQMELIRVTGPMEGQEITPWLIEYQPYSWEDEETSQEWQTLLRREGEMPADAVTLYSYRFDLCLYDKDTGSIKVNGTEYENMLAMAEAAASEGYLKMKEGIYTTLADFQKETLTEVIRVDVDVFYDERNWQYSEENPSPPLALYKVTAIRAKPLLAAVRSLRNVYIVSFLICLVGVLAMRKKIKVQLTDVVETVAQNLGTGERPVYSPKDPPLKWREPHELYDRYLDTNNLLRNRGDEIKRLQTALDYAKNAEEQRRTLTSNMAHELKTPLAIVRSHAEGLLEGIEGDRRQEYLEAIVSETDRMDGMILRMLELSRLEAGRVKLQREEFRLDELVEETLVRYQPSITGKGLTLEKDLSATVVSADRERVEEIIENLLTNAVKYCRQNGGIKISCRQRNRGGGELTVYNDADPLTEEAIERVWEPFYRVSSSRTDRGTGLGLPIVRGLVELHGGETYVRNTDGGVEFGFRI